MVKAVRIHAHGGPEVLNYEDIDLPDPVPGQVQVRHTAIGLNFLDTYQRSGLYKIELPSGMGTEAAGVITKLGKGVKGFKVGDRVAYGSGALGAYSQARNMMPNRLAKLPKSVKDEAAAGMMLKGMTVRYLLRSCFKAKRGDTVLFHAAAGGVGLIFGQWAKAIGVKAIGTVGSTEKVALAKAHGYTHVIDTSKEDIVARVKEITKGKMLPVVYDAVGKDTFEASLQCLRPRGLMVSFGNSSGPVTGFNVAILAARGSLYLTRPTLVNYISDDKEFAATVRELMKMVGSGKVKIRVNQRYPLAEVARAHTDLAARKTTGATVLVP